MMTCIMYLLTKSGSLNKKNLPLTSVSLWLVNHNTTTYAFNIQITESGSRKFSPCQQISPSDKEEEDTWHLITQTINLELGLNCHGQSVPHHDNIKIRRRGKPWVQLQTTKIMRCN